MRKKFFMFLTAVIVCACCGLIAACNSCSPGVHEPLTYIQLDRTELTLDVLARDRLTALIKDEDGNPGTGEITWTSSDTAVATVNADDGLIIALSAGTAQITARSGEMSASCTVTVENNGVRPQLQIGADTLDLKAGETSKVNPSVRFKSAVLDNDEYSIAYTYSASEGGVVSVSEDGTITALKYGAATVTVKADWAQAAAAGLDGNLTVTLTVNVLPSYTLIIGIAEGYGSDIYLQEVTDGNNTYHNTTVLEVVTAVYNGSEITSGLVFKSGDEDIVSVDAEGKVTLAATAAEGDTVEVWLEYATENEGVISSDRILLTVKKAVVHRALEDEQIIDLSKPVNLPVAEIFGTDGEEAVILSIYDADDALKTNIYDKTANAYRNVALFGQRKWVVVGEKSCYEIDVLAVSKIIMTAEDFAIFDDTTATSKEAFAGYYILGANIDASSLSFANKGYPGYGDGIGLTGTLDGRGYTIDGLKLGSGGLFGVVAKTGAVVNVAFTNVSVNAGANGLGLMFGWYYVGLMENVYIGINEFTTDGTSSSASLGLFAACNESTVFRNVVVVNSAQAKYTQSVAASQLFASLAANTNRGAWENTFVISPLRLFGGMSTYGDEGTTRVKSLQRFNDFSEMIASDFYASHKVAFGDIWDSDTMTFVSSAEYFDDELNGLPEAFEISVGNSVTVATNANAFKIELSSAAAETGVTFENGKLTATKYASSEGLTVTVTFGANTKIIPITINNSITVENFAYTFNLAEGDDFEIADGMFAGNVSQATVRIKGTDGQVIEMQASVADGSLKVEKSQFTGKIPSGSVQMSVTLDGATIGINGVKLVYAVNTADEFVSMREHLTAVETNKYDGSILIAHDIDLTDKTLDEVIIKAAFVGELDGGNRVVSNVSVTATASGAFFGALYGTVKNLIIRNATVSSYCGVICYDNYGIIENCYVKGSVTADGVQAASDNFGAGLLAAKNRNDSSVKNCIAELVSKGTTYVFGAFGKLGDGSASEEKIFENCYAVAAGEIALFTYGSARTAKNFDDKNGNKNFATIFDLFGDETASVLAAKLGLTAPVIERVEISNATLSLYVDGNATLTARAYTADGEAVVAPIEWSSGDEAIATVDGGFVTGVSAGSAVITVSLGQLSATCAVTVIKPALEDLVLQDFTYAFNGGNDFKVTGVFPSEAKAITARIKMPNGEFITLSDITVSGDTLTIPANQFNDANMPTKEVEMSVYFDEDEMIVRGVYLIYTVNTAEEYKDIINHLTLTGTNTYDGSILIGADIDFGGVSFASAYPLYRKTFNGELDGGNHVLSNIKMDGSASGAFCGTLYGVVKNVVITDAVLTTYGGIICDLNYGRIENCYVRGSITSDGVSAASDNFGAGLLAARNRNGSSVKNCIVELISKGTTYVSGAFGRLGDGSASEAKIFENCYAVSAENFALFTYGGACTAKNFDDKNGNKNFATIFDLFGDETASALAAKLGLTAPVIERVTISEESVTITVNGAYTLTATAYTADNVAVKANFAWTSGSEAVVTVENGVIKGIAAGSATITAAFGSVNAQCTVTVTDATLEDLNLTGFSYAYNGTEDFSVTGTFPDASEIRATIKGMDGNGISLTGITVSKGTLTIPAAQFKVANMPTKEVEMSIYFDGVPMNVNGVYLIYTITDISELQNMKSRLTAYNDGHLLLGSDIDFSGVTVTSSWGMKGVAFKGIFDGGLHTISNLTVPAAASQFGLLGNMQAGSVAKNIIMTNVEINTYCGAITYLNNGGTIQNCYVKGTIVKDGLSANSAPGNFGCGLLAGRSYGASAKIENCIVEVVSHGEINSAIYGAAAFGMTGNGVNESNYINCYAVNAAGFALCTNTKPSVFKDFGNTNNGNFVTLAQLFENAAAAELATALGLTVSA